MQVCYGETFSDQKRVQKNPRERSAGPKNTGIGKKENFKRPTPSINSQIFKKVQHVPLLKCYVKIADRKRKTQDFVLQLFHV